MNINNSLSIVLTLKDRHDFTIRWLDWAKKNHCKYNILIADGSKDDFVRSLLKKGEYNNLSIEYHRYSPDKKIYDWFNKLYKIVSRVKTKYVIHADNDDFILFDNLRNVIKKFNNLQDVNAYSRPQLRIKFDYVGKDLKKHLYPKKNIYLRKINYRKEFKILMEENSINRLEYVIRNFEASLIWYAVHKTENLKRIHKKILENNFKIVMMQEWYLYYSSIASGKCIIENDDPYLIRQAMTSDSAASLFSLERFDKIFLNNSWSRDLGLLIKDLYLDVNANLYGYDFKKFDIWFKSHFHYHLSSWNKFQYFADRFRDNKYYDFFKKIIKYLISFHNKNGSYKNYKAFNKINEINSLYRFLKN